MPKAESGDKVKVHYAGTLESGEQFDSSEGRDPLEFTLGEGQVIPGFEQAVLGLEPGESITVTIIADEAYGLHRQELVVAVERGQLPPELEPEVGIQLQSMQPGGRPLVATIVEVSEEEVKLDANHPLAGKDLTFEIELVEID